MKRVGLTALLFFGAVIAAHADNDVYNDATGRGRGDDLLHVDTAICDAQYGAPQNGYPTSAVYKRCMARRGWRFQETQLDPNNMVCSARVLRFEDTDWALNHHPVARMTLRVRPPIGHVYDTTIEKAVSWHHPPRQGDTMRVRCNPSDPSDIHPVD